MKGMRAARGVLAVALAAGLALAGLTLGAGLAHAAAVPQHLASTAAELYAQAEEELQRDDLPPERRAALQKTVKALREARIRHFARDPVFLPADLAGLGETLDIDPASAAGLAELNELLALDTDTARERLADRYDEPADLEDALAALAAARTGGDDLERRFEIPVSDGEDVVLDWRPDQNLFSIGVETDPDDPERFQGVLVGETALTANPETGAFDLAVAPADEPLRLMTPADFERVARSIFDAWVDEKGNIWTFSPLDGRAQSGDIRRAASVVQADIDAVEDEIEEIEEAVEYVWFDPTTEETVRQRRFRRLPEPWDYRGEQPVMADADAQIAALNERLASLRDELEGTDLLPAERDDPIGFDDAQRGGATPIRIHVQRADGHAFDFDQASFDGKTVRARRTLKTLPDVTNYDLPQWVREGLVASWSPPNWLDFEAAIDPVTGELSLVGNVWSMHVHYRPAGSIAGQGIVKIFDPYPIAKRLTLPGSTSLAAWGAADTALP